MSLSVFKFIYLYTYPQEKNINKIIRKNDKSKTETRPKMSKRVRKT